MYKEAVVDAIAGQQTEALASLRAALQKGLSGGASQERSGVEDFGYESRAGQAYRRCSSERRTKQKPLLYGQVRTSSQQIPTLK
jgi:hypothetical protein